MGTCVGGGMLALPIQTAQAGVGLSLLSFLLTAAIMLVTSWYVGELSFCKKGGINIVSLTQKSLGKESALLVLFGYLFLFYAFTVAYLSAIRGLSELFLTQGTALFLLFLLFGMSFLLYKGTSWVAAINQGLMIGLIGSYFFLICDLPSIRWDLLTRWESSALSLVFPVTVNAFNFHLIVPSLTSALNYDRGKFRRAILLGVALTFCIYLLWELLVLGHLSPVTLEQNPMNAIAPLAQVVGRPTLVFISYIFSFFAIITSLLGVSLAFLDIFSDAMQSYFRKREKQHLLLICLLLSSFFLVSSQPMLFRKAVTQWAGLGISLLSGVLPILLVWRERKRLLQRDSSPLFSPLFLLLLLAFFCSVIWLSV